jgi:hypothetical protein
MWQPIVEEAFGSDRALVASVARAAAGSLGNAWLLERKIHVRRRQEPAQIYARLLHSLYRSATTRTEASMLVDSSKTPWHAFVASEFLQAETYVLHLVRDPRGVAFSHGKSVPYDAHDRNATYMARHGVVKSSLAWSYRNLLIEQTWGRDALLLRYEDFVADPRAAVERVLTWTAVEPDLSMFSGTHEVEIAPIHNISGNPVRFRRGATRIAEDHAWRHGLPTPKQRLALAVSWPLAPRYGYAPVDRRT